LAVGQFGAPTAVVNATLWGFLEGAGGCEVLGVVGGPQGLLRGELRPIERLPRPAGARTGAPRSLGIGARVAAQPGAWLGAGRHRLEDDELDAAVQLLADAGVEGLALIGGNGTMRLASELHRRAVQGSHPISIVGLPKTVDNDLEGTDHAPGFPSAARFLVRTVRDLDLDHRAMTSIEPVRIVETLGRRTGWLALATLTARASTGGAPHLVYVPERPLNTETFLADVESTVRRHGRALVVVAEGVSGPSIPGLFDRDAYNRPISGGVSRALADLVRDHLGYHARAEVLGLIQRCSSDAVSPVDRREAHAVGVDGARLLRKGEGDIMVGLAPRQPGESAEVTRLTTTPLSEVAGHTRAVPPAWVPEPAGDAPDLVAWVRPLLGDLTEGWESEEGINAPDHLDTRETSA